MQIRRRTFISGAIATILLNSLPARAQGNIEPVKSPMEWMLECLPDQSGDTGDFAPVVFVDGTGPGWQQHNATESHLFQPSTRTRVNPEEWEGLVGFAPGDIEASIYQQGSSGALRIVKGSFGTDRIETIRDVIAGNGYDVVDVGEQFPGLRRATPAGELQDQYPTIAGIGDGVWDTIGFLDNQLLVIATAPDLVQMARDAQRKRIPYMTFGPGIDGIRRCEPDAVYEAVIVPASFVPNDAGGPYLLSVGVLTSYPETDTVSVAGISGARPTWTVITTLSWQEAGHLVTDAEVGAYVDGVRARFESGVSTRTGAPFSDGMSISSIAIDHGTVVITILPRTTVPGYYELTDMALNRDLGFLSPSGA